MSEFCLYFRYIRIHFLSQLQYRGWWIGVLQTLIVVVTDPLDAALMMDRFGSVGEYRPTQILLVYSIAVCAFGLSELFARGFDFFPNLVRTGEFDRLLLRPRSTVLQVATLRFHLTRLSRVMGMLALMIMCLRMEGALLSIGQISLLILAVFSGMLIYMGVFIIAATISFFTIQPLDIVYMFTNGSYQAAKVPPKYLPDWLRHTLTYVVPMFAFCFYPVASILGWSNARWPLFMCLPIAAAFLGVSLLFWQFGVSKYKSTGS